MTDDQTRVLAARQPLLRCEFPWPPTVNHAWRPRGRGKLYLSPHSREFRQVAVAVTLLSCHSKWSQVWQWPCTEPVELELYATPPDRRRRDLDNLLKAVLDGLVHGGAITDDSLVSRLLIERLPPESPGSVTVLLFAASTQA